MITAAAAVLAVLSCVPVYAHSLWLKADKYNPAAGEKVTITVEWGHGLNKKEKMKDALQEIFVIGPDGKKFVPSRIDDTRYSFKTERAGYYVIGASINSGFMTKTTSGRVKQSKKGLKGVISCMNYDIRTKAVIKAGVGSPAPAGTLDAPLEIIPAGDISSLKKGNSVQVQILFKGKPAAGLTVTADYDGYAGRSHDDHAVSVKTDSSGKATLTLSSKGPWLIQVRQELPYPDRDVCDTSMHAASLCLTVN